MLEKIKIHRNVTGIRRFDEVFEGFEEVAAIRRIFGRNSTGVISNLKVKISQKPWYMWVDDEHERLMVYKGYLKTGDKLYLYLDVLHELVHIRQMGEGRDLWDEKYDYVERPTEVEAYKVAVKEAKRLGMGRKELRKYVVMEEWPGGGDWNKLCKRLGI